eukprot:2024-Heterococcus_DN1.PRE.2
MDTGLRGDQRYLQHHSSSSSSTVCCNRVSAVLRSTVAASTTAAVCDCVLARDSCAGMNADAGLVSSAAAAAAAAALQWHAATTSLFFSVQYLLAQAAPTAAAVVVAAAGQLRQATTKLCCGTVFYALLTQTLRCSVWKYVYTQKSSSTYLYRVCQPALFSLYQMKNVPLLAAQDCAVASTFCVTCGSAVLLVLRLARLKHINSTLPT